MSELFDGSAWVFLVVLILFVLGVAWMLWGRHHGREGGIARQPPKEGRR